MKYLYGVEYWSGKATTLGQANRITGRYNVACSIKAFASELDRQEWLERSDKRHKIGKSRLRSLCLGMSVRMFNDMLDHIELQA